MHGIGITLKVSWRCLAAKETWLKSENSLSLICFLYEYANQYITYTIIYIMNCKARIIDNHRKINIRI